MTEDLRFNTAISQMMIFVNEMNPRPVRPRAVAGAVRAAAGALRAAPGRGTVAQARATPSRWPTRPGRGRSRATWSQDTVTVVVQVNGKVRDRLEVPAGAGEDEVQAARPGQRQGRAVARGQGTGEVGVVPGKLVSLVVK